MMVRRTASWRSARFPEIQLPRVVIEGVLRQPVFQPCLRDHRRQGRLGSRGVGRCHQELQRVMELEERHCAVWITLVKTEWMKQPPLARTQYFGRTMCFSQNTKTGENQNTETETCFGLTTSFWSCFCHKFKPQIELWWFNLQELRFDGGAEGKDDQHQRACHHRGRERRNNIVSANLRVGIECPM